MSKKLLILVVVAVLIVGGWLVFRQNGNEALAPENTENVEESVGDDSGAETTSEVSVEEGVEETVVEDDDDGVEGTVVTYTDGGFSPESVEIAAGDTVTFRNNSSRGFWPASASHPTHKVYPDSDIAKCNTDSADSIFDACASVSPGSTYSFTFDEIGTWNYHDHFRAGLTGTVVVQ